MKKSICVIGPLPPPMNGLTKALDTILRSNQFNSALNINMVNLSSSQVGMSGQFSFQKVRALIRALINLKDIQKREKKINTYYLTIAQSTFGCLRDVTLLNQIYNNKENARVVLHLHGGGFQRFYKNANPILRDLIKRYYSKADTLIVLSHNLKSMFDGVVNKEKIQVVENCVDNAFLISDSDIEKKLRITKSKSLRIVYLSNMIKTKGYLDVLCAAKILNEMKIDCEFIFAGKFVNYEQKNEFYKFIIDNRLDDYVKYLGVVGGEDKKGLLMNGDIFILPTYYPPEGQPISILEAMASGMAIITTKHGGIPDIISEGVNGFFVREQDPKTISEKVIEMVHNPQIVIDMGKNNRRVIMEKHLEKHYINNMIQVLNS